MNDIIAHHRMTLLSSEALGPPHTTIFHVLVHSLSWLVPLSSSLLPRASPAPGRNHHMRSCLPFPPVLCASSSESPADLKNSHNLKSESYASFGGNF